MPRDGSLTRASIVKAATRLFYIEGIRAVSLDAVAERAGVTKKTLYYHFASKDELVAASLESQDQPVLALYRRWYEDADGNASSRVKAMFEGFRQAAERSQWRGCGFLRTIAELANLPGHPAVRIGQQHKKRFERWLGERLAAEHVQSPDAVARSIMLLMEGAATIMLIHRDGAYVTSAGNLASEIVKQALSAHHMAKPRSHSRRAQKP